MKKLEEFLQRFIGPIAEKMSNNDVIQSVAEGFMRTGPVTFGVCIFVILGNLPIDGYSDWLISIGMKAHFDAISN
ncbi:MAG: PTS sugar transporter subunit IIC, partial [Longibaculum sp.]